MSHSIYLDHNATTPPHPDVLDAMRACAEDAWANASSVHRFGQRARAELDRARAAVAQLCGKHPRDVLLTSGGTEANNIALASLSTTGLVTTAIEHPSVLRTARRLEARGVAVGIAEVSDAGAVTVSAVERAMEAAPDAKLLSIQVVNHETGVVQPTIELTRWAHEREMLVHVDAVQAVGKLEPTLWRDADLVSLAAHKMRGPKGIGALITRPRVKLEAMMGGGEQERGLRPGTQSAALAAGFRVAAERADHHRYEAMQSLRDDLEAALAAAAEAADIAMHINGSARRAPHVSNQSWDGWSGPELCAALDLEGIAISSGAACSAGTAEPSAVIRAMAGEARARSAIRISMGETTTRQDLDELVRAMRRVTTRSLP